MDWSELLMGGGEVSSRFIIWKPMVDSWNDKAPIGDVWLSQYIKMRLF